MIQYQHGNDTEDCSPNVGIMIDAIATAASRILRVKQVQHCKHNGRYGNDEQVNSFPWRQHDK